MAKPAPSIDEAIAGLFERVKAGDVEAAKLYLIIAGRKPA